MGKMNKKEKRRRRKKEKLKIFNDKNALGLIGLLFVFL